MSWYKIKISAQQAATNYHGEIQDQFEKIFIISQNLKEIALFSGGWSTSDMFNMYFTTACASNPAIKALMESNGAELCDEPTRETERELGLLVGDQHQWGEHIWSPDLY